MSDINKILSKLKNVKKIGNHQFKGSCPAHNDNTPSLTVSEKNNKILLYCHAGCTYDAIINALGLKSSKNAYTMPKSMQPRDDNCTLEDYSKHKGIPEDYLREEFKARSGKSCSFFPYFDSSGKVVATRIRSALAGDNKFKWKKGSKLCLYGLARLKDTDEDFIFLVEGESDCQTLIYNGFPALGVPGANNFNDGKDSKHFEKFKKVIVPFEDDTGGRTLLKSIENSSIADKVMVAYLNRHKDISAMFLDNQKYFKNRLKQFMKRAVPIAKFEGTLKQIKCDKLFKQCKDITNNKDILSLFYDDVQQLGVVGEEKYVKTLYLCLTTRFFKDIVSLLVRGASSSGKSYTVQKILKHFFPKSACYDMTSMSPKALIYTDESFKNRFIWIYEQTGINNADFEYLLRTLLSEGCLKYEVTEKGQNGQFGTRKVEKEGPSGLILTTAKLRYNQENENRCITLVTDDGKEQSKIVLKSIAKGYNNFDTSKWLILQEWLSLSNHDVLIPYSAALADLLDTKATRIRRDFTKVLSLIRAHCLIHQQTRKKDSKGRIKADLNDYKAVRILINDVLSASIEKTVPEHVREIVDAVDEIQEEQNGYVTNLQLSERLKIHRSTASRRVNEALNSGFLVNMESNPNKTKQLDLGEDMPKNRKLLPSVQKLKKHLKKLK